MNISKKILVRKNEIIKSIKTFKGNPVENLGTIIPAIMVVLGMIMFIIAYVMFCVSGGYGTQIEFLKEDFFGGIIEGFTYGKVDLIYTSFVSIIVCIMFIVQYIMATISAISNGSKAKKIVLIILASISVLLLCVTVMLFCSSVRDIRAFFGVKNVKTFGEIIIIATLVINVIFVIVLSVLKRGWMLGYGIVAIGIYYILIPLALMLIQNIIPLICVLIIFAIVRFVIRIIITGDSSESNSNRDNDELEKTRTKRMAEKEEKKKNDKVNALIREMEGLEENIRKHNNNEVGYGTIDPKTCRNRIERIKQELKSYGVER